MKIQVKLSEMIIKLRVSLGLSQSELGKQLGGSAMGVSRWERGTAEPSGEILIKMGILAQQDVDACWDFWERAGLRTENVIKVLPGAPKKWNRTVPILQIVAAGPRHKFRDDDLVAIPLLRIVAAAGKERGGSHHDLRFSRTKQAIVAPRLWCPNPKDTICMEVKGDSMEPVLHDGHIIVVDQKQNDRKKLNGEMVVVRHQKFGLVVTRFRRIKNAEALLSDNRCYEPVPWTSAWHIVGKVLWWIGLPSKTNVNS